ncbi:hypothetical protein E3N88_04147 [Mikania micrantha]|uniref:Uncharacterized protein n=1 Tax=Mikania micrantha TaxID=192012 RepID=A0A5N6PTL0_9ASTR|nr:hypothetical protein E3N88_04147 [Mikania micrantha]
MSVVRRSKWQKGQNKKARTCGTRTLLTGDIAETSDAAAKTASVVETSKVAGGEDIGADKDDGGAVMGDEDRVDKV